MTRLRALTVVASLVAAAAVALTGPAADAGAVAPESVPVLELHGFDSAECPGTDVSAYWSSLNEVFERADWTGPLLPVSYYRCDNHGADVTGYGPDTPVDTGIELSPDAPRGEYRQDTSLVTIAHDLAWYVYRNFSVAGRSVDLVALSLGGLIAREALHQVQLGNPDFPPYLRVAQAVTFSTPHHGLNTVAENGNADWCHHLLQCEEVGADSDVMTELMRDGTDPQGDGGTRWTVFGSSAGNDFVPVASALGLPHARQIDYTDPGYDHTAYIFDTRADTTATATVRDGDDGTAVTSADSRFSLARAVDLLAHPEAEIDPAPPTPVVSTPSPSPSPSPVPSPTAGAVVVPPTVVVTSLPAVTVTSAVRVRFRATPGTTVDLRYRIARGAGADATWFSPASAQGLSGAGHDVRPPNGTTGFCVSARPHGTSGWGPATCTAVVVDDRALRRSSRWVALGSAAAVGHTLSRARAAGALASLRVRGGGIAIVATTCAHCGSLQVSVAGRPWRTVSTRSATTRHVVVLRLPTWGPSRTATVTLRTTSRRPVYLDGLAVLR